MHLIGWFLIISLLSCVSPGACFGKADTLQHKRALTDMGIVGDNLGDYMLFNMTVVGYILRNSSSRDAEYPLVIISLKYKAICP